MENDLLKMLRAHIAEHGYAKPEDFEGLTCVPPIMKRVMLGTETEDDLFRFETWMIDTYMLEFYCFESFYGARFYENHADYAAAIAWEYAMLREKKLFPEELLKGGFFTFFYQVVFESTTEDIKEFQLRSYGEADTFEVRRFENMAYLIRYPKSFERGKKYPVILLLHGAGSRGKHIEVLKNNSYFAITEKQEDFPFITVAPLCHENSWFDLWDTMKKFVTQLRTFDFCDPNRLYAMGPSMGGYAVWQLAMTFPSIFAAIVPICGGGMYWNAERLLNVPVWAFHGEKDEVVFPEETKKMVQNINLIGGRARMTLYPDCDHDAWTKTYQNPEVFKWLLSKKKG